MFRCATAAVKTPLRMDGDNGHKPEKTIMTTQKTNFRKVCANSVTKCKDNCDDRVWYKPRNLRMTVKGQTAR